MRIAFRVDASVLIGTGHVMRCLTLADELAGRGHQCLFICRDHQGHLGQLITRKGFALFLLPRSRSTDDKVAEDSGHPYTDWLGVSWQQDAEQVLDLLASVELDWLVVDHYALDAQWERKISKAVGRILVVDDLAGREHECDLLLDQNLGRQVSDYDRWLPEDCVRLIGPRYALLRPEFAAVRERSLERRQAPELKRILISLGGVDQTNVTGEVLSVLAKTPLAPETELDIIMGAAAPYLNDVSRQASQLPFRAAVSVGVDNIAERMCMADLSIGAAGSTSWERCCLGLPSIMMILADNQRMAARALDESGAAIAVENSGMLADVLGQLATSDDLAGSLAPMVSAGAKIIDGKGSSRVANKLASRSATL